MNRWLVVGLFVILQGCALFQRDDSMASVDPRVRVEQEQQLSKAEEALEQNLPVEAERLFLEFQMNFPNSVFFQKSELGLGQALERQERWSEAAEKFRNIVEINHDSQPEIAAHALYELSSCYESLGDDSRLFAALMDLEAFKKYLKPEQALAEIPARLAAAYNRTGRSDEARKYMALAEDGVQSVRIQQLEKKNALGNPADTHWISQVYYKMGRFSTHQISSENIQAYLDTLKMVQIFSLRAIEGGGQPWSDMADKGLTENYRDVWAAIQGIPMNRAMDTGAALRELIERKTDLIGQMLTMINDLRLHRSPQSEALTGPLFQYLGSMEKKAESFLYRQPERTPLTMEEKKRQALKKERASLVKPEDPKPTEPTQEKSDPNL
ncbi:MAG: hypothetical protein COT73_07000 [Bdellovibrio sp. CG10_big_fil_rev_8_21_14_0_10_47_8]|nr:MAG: hypothetical protein COT73_07000 [Bdellovibrio sp. CG10_big_fil_rev_8_21_14_0_10_47_8]